MGSIAASFGRTPRIWLGLLVVGACAPRSIASDRERVTEQPAGCEACLADLVACVSTSRGDAQFVQCRDLFAACQQKSKLAPASCQNPRGAEACAACDDRRAFCETAEPDTERCSEDHAQCVTRLEGSAECAGVTNGVGGEANCSDCHEGGAGGTAVAEGGAGGEGGTATVCHGPCELGEPMEASCGACASAVCTADAYCCTTAWDKYCVKTALDVPACGCTTSSCSHSECSPGDGLAPDCSNCATLVCAAKPSCCSIEWDSACVVEAAAIGECACAGF